MPKTVNGEIDYCDKPGYALNFDMTPSSGGVHDCKRVVQVQWAKAHAFPAAVLGDATLSPGGGTLLRLIPEQHPVFKHMFATRCSLMNGLGAWLQGDNGLIHFKDSVNKIEGFAEFEIIYSTLPYDVKANIVSSELERYVSRETKFNLEVYQVPGDAFVWKVPKIVKQPKPGPQPGEEGFVVVIADFVKEQAENKKKQAVIVAHTIPETVPLQRPVLELRYTWHWVPEPVPRHIFLIAGHVNNKDFDGNVFDKGHLLLSTIEISERKWTPAGSSVRDISYTFSFRPDAPWSQLYRKSTNKFEEVRSRNTGEPLYEFADFSRLFNYSGAHG